MTELEKFELILSWIENQNGPMKEGTRNSHLFKLAVSANKYGLDRDFVMHEALQRWKEDSFPESEIFKTVNKAFADSDKHGTKHFREKNESFNSKQAVGIKNNIATRSLNQQELDYWIQYGITAEILKENEVFALDSYYNEVSEPDNPIFCYKVQNSLKIYRPYAKEGQRKFIWIGIKPKNWIFRLDRCTGGDRVFIAAGEKDALTLAGLGFQAFTLNSETTRLTKKLANQLKKLYKEVVVIYDNDATGIDESKKIVDEFSFIRAVLPDGIKDTSDLIKAGKSFGDVKLEYPEEDNFFNIKTANEWLEEASKMEPRPQLFGTFWTQGELCYLYADTSLGKSILAVQLGNDLCSGKSTLGLTNDSKRLKGIYFDFELSVKQFEKRNSNEKMNHFQFHENFMRAELNGSFDYTEDFEEIIFEKIENAVRRWKADFIIIDNLSWLHSETEKAKFAVGLMRKLKILCQTEGISIMVINHTTKTDDSRPIKGNDMAGSKMLLNLADSAFTIGKSGYDKDGRYLKEIKHSRTCEAIYTEDNVIECRLTKSDRLLFEYVGLRPEWELLRSGDAIREPSLKEKQKYAAEVLKSVGLSNVKIAELIGVTEGTIRNWLKSPYKNYDEKIISI